MQKSKYHSGLGGKSCGSEVFGHCVCVRVRVCACVWKPRMFSCILRTPLESANFLCTSSRIMNHITTALLYTSSRPGGGKLSLLRVLTNDPALRAQQPLHVDFFTGISSIHRLFGSRHLKGGITVERFFNRFKVCSGLLLVFVGMHACFSCVRHIRVCDA